MVAYIKSDLEFILQQIKIAEDHSLYQATNGAQGKQLFGPDGSIPTYNLAWGLRTVDGSYNHLLNPQWGAADEEFPENLGTDFRTLFVDADPGEGVMMVPMTYTPGVDNDGPTTTLPDGQIIGDRAGPGDVIDPTPRIISNLIVDQTLGNPAAILTALERAGVDDADLSITNSISAAYAPLRDNYAAIGNAERVYATASAAAAASPGNAELQQAAATALAAVEAANQALLDDPAYPALSNLLAANGIELEGINLVITNSAPDEGLSAPFNSWFTLFGQFFDHGLDLVAKGGAGTIMIPLMPGDPLYVEGSQTNFMVLTRATTAGPGPDGILVDDPATAVNEAADNTDRPINNTTAFVDQNQTYSSHPSHQVFLREYALNAAGDPVATGGLIKGVQGGMATWADLKAQAADLLGIQLLNSDVGNVPLLLTDPYGEFIRGANGYPQFVTATGLVEANPEDNGGAGSLVPANTLRTGHAFLADIAHTAVPDGLADGDIEIGLGNPGVGGEPVYDDELLDAHYVAGDGRANENVGLTAVHHVFHAEHNRLVEHTKVTVLETRDLAFINEWLLTDLTQAQVDALPATLPTDPAALATFLAGFTWDGERIFQAAKFGTEMQYQHLVFEEFARKIQPNINVFLVPDGYDVTIDPSIVAEFAHVVYRFGHSMLTESIDRFDGQFNADHIGLIEGFLNPLQFENNGGSAGVDADIAAGAIVRGMTRQVGNEIDEFVTSALRNNLLGLPLDLATINLARGRDTGVPSLNEARAQFYEATNHDPLLKPYESWVDFASHLKHEASIINFIASYGTHETITSADTLEGKRDAAMALIGLTTTGSETVAIENSSFELDSMATGSPNVNTDPLGNYTFTPPTGWTMTGTGGVFAPAATITNAAGLQGTNVAWLGQDALLSKETGVIMEEGARYSLSFDMADRTDMEWPGGVARLVASNGDVLATQALAAPADGQWSAVSFETLEVDAAHAGMGLRIEIQQAGGSGNQILVDDVQLNVIRQLAPLDEEDRLAFLNGTGQYADDLGGLNDVDLWIGGLAEEIMPFGGMLGSTFNFVFEIQMEKLQSGDRFYYLQRLDGLHLFGEMENNSFAAMIMRNTDATHLPSDVFSTPGLILEVDQTRQYNDLDGDGVMEQTDPTGGGILTPDVVRNNPATAGTDTNYLRYQGDEHVLLGGTEQADIMVAGIGDDTLYGDGGNDKLEGGFGNDIINAGDGDDIVTDMGGDDNIKAGKGHDVVHAGPGLDLVMGNDGQDFIFLGTDMGSEVFAGTGNDFIYGNKNAERILGNEGDDWIETGTFDGAPGDNFDEIFAHDGIDGNDVFLGDGGFDEYIGEGGDDIMVGSPGRGKMAGMSGFDWATYKDNTMAVNADLSIPIIFDEAPTLPQNASLDEYASMEGLSGTRFNDVLKGSNALAEERLPVSQGGTGAEGYLGSYLDAQGIALIAGLQEVLGEGVSFYNAGDIILGGDGSDVIQGNAGDDIIDGDKWLNVRIGIMSGFDANGPVGTEIAGNPNIRSMTSLVTLRLDANGNVVTAPTGGTPTTKTLSAWMFEGKLNPGQLQIIREITTAGADAVADVDVARFQGARGEYAFSATADGQVIVTHAVEDSLDGTDRLRNIEQVQFATGNALNIVVGTPYDDNGLAPQGPAPLNQPVINGTANDDLILGLAGADVLNAGAGDDILVGGAGGNSGTFRDEFATQSFTNNNGSVNFSGGWTEGGGETGGATFGDIQINLASNGRLHFNDGVDGGEFIQRAMNLAGATSATVEFSYVGDVGLTGTENVTVQALNLTTGIWETLAGGVLQQTGTGLFSATLSAAQIGPNSAIRLVANGDWDPGDDFFVENFQVTASGLTNAGVDTLNGGLGNDTYSFALGDGNDVINEAVNATSGGTADRISILAPSTGTDPETGLPILTIDALGATDNNAGTQAGDLVINYTLPTGSQQTVTVAGHYSGTNAQTGVEFINFNGAFFAGHQLVGDYAISRQDGLGNNRNLAASVVNSLIAVESGSDGTATGGSGNDLIFGGAEDDDLVGGLGDDLLVGGAGNDELDARGNGNPADPDFVGALGADTLIGGAGNDTYGVDDILDVVVENAGEGTDTIETFMAALSLETLANVENLTFLGADAEQFVGTGNAGNNTIGGGDLADTLSGLGGNDTLNGGLGADTLNGGDGNDTLNGGDDNDALNGGLGNDTLNGGTGADTMAGGDGNDIYDVDQAGDIVSETNADSLVGGVDRVDSDVSYTLGANLENLTLTGAAAIGRGNALANVIVGNGSANQLFGAGGNDTLTGNAGDDLLDGGSGDDTLSGGDQNDTIIGGAGNDTIDVGTGFNTLVYNAAGFGADTIASFDAIGGAATNQDKIDLSGLGITAATFANRVFESASGGNTIITIRENGAASAIQGTIQINGIGTGDIDVNDFTLAAASTTLPGGSAANNTLNGTPNNDIINALAGNDTVNGGAGNDTISGGLNGIGGPGADILNGDAGDDTFIWNANASGDTDGRDVINGGLEGAAGDTFVINGNASSEVYRVYTRAAWDSLPGTNLNTLNPATEIVVMRQVGVAPATIIAELREIEEIRINSVDPAGTSGGAGTGDTFEIIGDFSSTSLRLNTITIDGQAGDDTIDISSLGSAHRIVFRSNGGNDTIIGTLRPQDVIELPEGATIADYEVSIDEETGLTTLTSDTQTITFHAPEGMPSFGGGEQEQDDDEDPVETPDTPVDGEGDETPDEVDDTDEDAEEDEDEDDAVGVVSPGSIAGTAVADILLGTASGDVIIALGGDDILRGQADDDFLSGGAGRDMVFGGIGNDDILGGGDADMLYGDAGSDRIFGDEGDDLIDAGIGNDHVQGGAGNDTILAVAGDGDDSYWGNEGVDTLDISAITANITANLGTGAGGRGSAGSSQSGSDALWGIENIVTGSGNDVITASSAVNVIDGGAGNDTFRFLSATDANGDTILGFQPGDRIDLSGIDADSGSANHQFTLVTGTGFNAAGALRVTHQTVEGQDYTLVEGNTNGGSDAEFTLKIKGNHTLTASDFDL
jgi:Ca2+-binding RTX toxin-like protein